MANHEWIFSQFLSFCASEWPRTWLESVSNLIKFHAEHFGMLYLPPGGSGRSQWWKNHQKSLKWLKKHPLFDGFLHPDRLPGLRYGLMGPRCDRLSKMSSTHSSGGGRGHIEASGASWVSHPDFTKGFYYITQKFHVHSSLQYQRHETRDSSHFFQSPPGKIRLGYFFWVRGGQLLYDVPYWSATVLNHSNSSYAAFVCKNDNRFVTLEWFPLATKCRAN